MTDRMAEFIDYMNSIFSQLFSKFIVAIIILLIGFIIGRLVGKLINRFLHEIELNAILKKAGVKFALEGILGHLAAYFIYFVTIIWALNTLGLTTTILNMISAAFLVLLIISLLLAVKDFVPNLIAGFFIYQKNTIKPGDHIKVDNVTGKVKRISLVEIEIKTSSGDLIHIPNSLLSKRELRVKKK